MRFLIAFICSLLLGLSSPAIVFAQDNPEVRLVTNLNDSGKGSLRDALLKDGPATILFHVIGDILLESPLEIKGKRITLDASNVSLSGKEAKADKENLLNSVRLVGFGLVVSNSNIELRNLRIWVGDRFNDPNVSANQDGILIKGTKERSVQNIKILNCTVFGAVDEGISTYGPVKNLDIGRNMILWGLSNSHHQDVVDSEIKDINKNHHSMAVLVSSEAQEVRFVQNLLVLNRHRNPRVMPGASVGFVNNVVYGWGTSIDDGLYLAEKKGVTEPLKIAFLANYYKGGTSSYYRSSSKASAPDGLAEFGSIFRLTNAKRYLIWDKGNKVVGSKEKSSPFNQSPSEFNSDINSTLTEADFKTLLPPNILTAEKAFELVLKTAGAFPDRRDALEELAVKNVIKGEGSFINSPRELSVGYPY